MNINNIKEIIDNKRNEILTCEEWIDKTYGIKVFDMFNGGYIKCFEKEIKYCKIYNGHLLSDQDILTIYDQCEILDKLRSELDNLLKYQNKFIDQHSKQLEENWALKRRQSRKQKAEKIEKKYGKEIRNLYYKYGCTDIKKEKISKDYYTGLYDAYDKPSRYKEHAFEKLFYFYKNKATEAEFLGILNAGIQHFSTLTRLANNLYIKDTKSKRILCVQ